MKFTSLVITSTILLSASPLCAADLKITFEGRYEYRTDAESQEMLGEQVCFYPNRPSSEMIPRPTDDKRLPWFCFRNSKQAAHLFGFALNARSNECGLKGNARVTVSSYTRYLGEGDDNDVATLDVVLEKSKPDSLPCSN